MKKHIISLTLVAAFLSSPSYAFFGLGSKSDDALDTGKITDLASNVLGEQPSSTGLVDSLTKQLNISPEQASGGAGALLSLASNSLSGPQSSELTNLIPGMSSLTDSIPGLSNLTGNLDALNGIFETLGLDPSLVSQFAPIMLDYLTQQNASSGLIDSLTSIWK